jgi:hypothetical protein
MMLARTIRLLALAVVATAVASPATAETTQCTAINQLPYTITSPGTYCLTGDLTTSIATGNAISVNTNSVTVDLNGHRLAGTGGAGSQANGISATNRKYVFVKNGTIRGFYRGVSFQGTDTTANTVEDITADRNWQAGVALECTGCTVRRNVVVNTGGTTIFGANSSGLGIFVYGGSGNVVKDNTITEVTRLGSSFSFGIYIAASNSVAENNRVASAIAGVAGVGQYILLSDNYVTNSTYAIYAVGGDDVKYRNTFTSGVTTLASGGIDAGGNH